MNRHEAFARRVSERHRRSGVRPRTVPLSLRRATNSVSNRFVVSVDRRTTLASLIIRPELRMPWHERRTRQVPSRPSVPASLRVVEHLIRHRPQVAGHRLRLATLDHPLQHRAGVVAIEWSRRSAAHEPALRSSRAAQRLGTARPADSSPVKISAVPTNLRRSGSATVPAAAPPSVTPFEAAWGPSGPPLQAWSAAQPLPTSHPSAADLERLTDHVVAAIDRRLIAYRERTGRG